MVMSIFSFSMICFSEEPSGWSEESITELLSYDWLHGSVFSDYSTNINRLEFSYLMVSFYELYFGEIEIDHSIYFSDTSDPVALKAASVDISSGVGNNRFDPDASITREQMAVLLINTLKQCNLELKEEAHLYSDDGEISSWAKEASSICKVESLMNGTGNNMFSPKGNASREMAYVVLNKMINNMPMAKRLIIRQQIMSDKYALSTLLEQHDYSEEVFLEINKVSETYDYDGDGLTDYYEIYRNFSDPSNKDSDHDGILDGDWHERTEYTYTIKAEIRLIEPYDLDFIESHIEQDMRLIEKTEDYADIELIIYPFHKMSETVIGNSHYKLDNASLMSEITPGLTNDWDEKYQEDLLRLLKGNGIDPEKMTDQELVFSIIYFFEMEDYNGLEGYVSEFSDITDTSYHMYDWYTSYVNGKAVISPLIIENRPEVLKEINDTLTKTVADFTLFSKEKWTNQDLINLASSTKEMFYRRAHGSCSGTSEFYASVFQSLGIPTKVMPIATTIDTGKMHDENGGEHQSLYQLRVSQGKNFSNGTVQSTWLRGLGDFGSGHVMNYIYLGNRWVNVDISGGMTFNRQPIMGDFIVFHKTADYDFYNTLQKITEQWLITDRNYLDTLSESENFVSTANDVSHYFGNFSLKVYNIFDEYGENMTYETRSIVDSPIKYEKDMLNLGRDLRQSDVVNDTNYQVFYAFDNYDNFDVLIDQYYPNVNLSFFGIYGHLKNEPEKFLHEGANLLVSAYIDYNELPNSIQNIVTEMEYFSLKSGVTTYNLNGAEIHFIKQEF